MSTEQTVTRPFHVRQGARGRREREQGEARTVEAAARIPRVSRLMALAIRFDGLIRDGVVTDPAELARLGHVTRARLTQIMTLLNLAPDIQEEVLFLPSTAKSRDAVSERDCRPVAAEWNWRTQRRIWRERRG
jgi:hypothetical protein